MAYTTALQVAQASGLGVRIIDENVGTGDASETDFDLDKDNIVAGSYTLSYAASGSNTFTALTETTHYTLDKESGRIVLTSAGVTALSTNILYATYFYIDNLGPDLMTQWITWADKEVEETTKRNWGTPTAYSQYFDGRAHKDYPTTDMPFVSDWDAPEYLVLDKTPVTGVNYIHIIQNNQPLSACYQYDNSEATYEDDTTEANSAEGTAFNPFATTPAANDIIYVGCSFKFTKANFIFSTVGVGAPTFTWSYWNGSSWTSFTPTTDGTSSFTSNGMVQFSLPANWTKVSVNSSTAYYWVRALIDGTFTTPPTLYNIVLKDVIADTVSLKEVDWEDWGKLSFTNYSIPNGTRNILINYNHGYTTTPDLIAELSAIYVGIRAFVYITGGSFDDVTSASLGSKSVSVGEPYINMREALKMLKDRAKEILRLVGQRYDIEVG